MMERREARRLELPRVGPVFAFPTDVHDIFRNYPKRTKGGSNPRLRKQEITNRIWILHN